MNGLFWSVSLGMSLLGLLILFPYFTIVGIVGMVISFFLPRRKARNHQKEGKR